MIDVTMTTFSIQIKKPAFVEQAFLYIVSLFTDLLQPMHLVFRSQNFLPSWDKSLLLL